jgi:hypothetical protein
MSFLNGFLGSPKDGSQDQETSRRDQPSEYGQVSWAYFELRSPNCDKGQPPDYAESYYEAVIENLGRKAGGYCFPWCHLRVEFPFPICVLNCSGSFVKPSAQAAAELASSSSPNDIHAVLHLRQLLDGMGSQVKLD